MNNKSPIGVFDSGLGGLTVVKEIIKTLPNEDIIYLGDTARVPYGPRSKETVTKFSFENAEFLLKKKVKCIVIACNTSSAYAGDSLKRKLKVPVFDVIEPALRDARRESKAGKIGVIGTRGTIASGAYNVPYSQACPLFVPFIEEGVTTGEALEIIAKKYLTKLKSSNIDTLILGCTHYPIIRGIIEKNVDGGKVKIIDPAKSVSVQLKNYLTEHNLRSQKKTTGQRKYFVTDFTQRFVSVAEMFLDAKIKENLRKTTL